MLADENDGFYKDVKYNSIIMNHIWATNGHCMSEPKGRFFVCKIIVWHILGTSQGLWMKQKDYFLNHRQAVPHTERWSYYKDTCTGVTIVSLAQRY